MAKSGRKPLFVKKLPLPSVGDVKAMKPQIDQAKLGSKDNGENKSKFAVVRKGSKIELPLVEKNRRQVLIKQRRKFAKFAKFPPEIRRIIWACVANESQRIYVSANIVLHAITIQYKVPAVLQVNVEARTVAKDHYKLCFSDHFHRKKPIRFNPKCDVLFLQNACAMTAFFGSLESGKSETDNEVFEGPVYQAECLRFVTVGGDTTSVYSALEYLPRLRDLKTLTLAKRYNVGKFKEKFEKAWRGHGSKEDIPEIVFKDNYH